MEFRNLLEAAHESQRYLYAKDTAKNIKSHLRTYLIFCTYYKRVAVPANVDTLVCFAEFMSFTAGYHHIKHLFASVRLLHDIYNVEFIQSDFRVDINGTVLGFC